MSKREQEKTVEATQRIAEEAKNTAQAQIGQQQAVAQEFQTTVNKSLEETKQNVRKSLDEARNQIPQYTNAVKNYQEKALESTGKMVEDFVEAQKSVIDSVSSSAAVYYENANRMLIGIRQKSPQKYGLEQLATLQKMCQRRQESITTSYSETLML